MTGLLVWGELESGHLSHGVVSMSLSATSILELKSMLRPENILGSR